MNLQGLSAYKSYVNPPSQRQLTCVSRTVSRIAASGLAFASSRHLWRRIPASVQNLPDPGESHKIVITQQEYPHRATDDDREINAPRQMIGPQQRNEEYDRCHVHQVDPVRCIGQV